LRRNLLADPAEEDSEKEGQPLHPRLLGEVFSAWMRRGWWFPWAASARRQEE